MTDYISRSDVFEIIDKAFSQPVGDVVTLYADICLMLNALPTHANSRSTHERDLISRADAIEAVRLETSKLGRGLLGKGDILDIIEALPSADAVSREDYEDIIKDYRKQYENMNNEIADLEAKLSADSAHIHNDGTLEVKVSNAQKVGRVLVMDTDSHIGGGLFYPDDAEQGDECDHCVYKWGMKGGDDE